MVKAAQERERRTAWAPPLPKVTGLITRATAQGPELVVFDHGIAGIQLPAGTVDDGETFEAAALREAWEETGARGLELVRELAVVGRDYVGRGGAIARRHLAAGHEYLRGNHLTVLSVDGARAEARMWDGALVSVETIDIARSEVRRVYHLRTTVEMPDEWLVVSPDGFGSTWTCFWVPFDDAYEMLHEYQRDWLDAARPGLDTSAVEDPPPRPRAPLPPEFDGTELTVQFHAPPFGGRLIELELTDDCDPEACTRAHGLCVTEDGQMVLVSNGDGLWDVPGGGKERGETIAETFAREVWEEACARIVESRFLCGIRFAELDKDGTVHHADLHTQMWARVRLEPWNPRFEIVERRIVSPEDAIDLCVFTDVTALLVQRAALVDPLLVREST